MNTIALTGRLTSEVELKKTPNGVSVCSFCLAVKRPRVKDETDFINCVAWRNTAEFIAQYFHKGDKIEISGILTSRNYTDSNGNKRTVFEVVADLADFAESKKQTEAPTQVPQIQYTEIEANEDLPF